ncbi:ankyrin repeat domain-containing protein [Ehrlichia japonica]|uniref:Ankyrin repeat family protein n=1 Tax=Ehrlichia japonica TaxID=391036 RepID=X5H060_9RICK|nr:ankyrin repeat domain-containing protein [Ehrlichia japonica]AHX04209.1 ankyrin repeat family protein [Ehrlichia japonica]
MLNGNVQHYKDNGAVSGGVQQCSDNIVLLSKEENEQLSKLKTQGIPPIQVVNLNKLLADALADGDFKVFFRGLLSLLKSRKKAKVKRNCQFIIYQNGAGYCIVVDSVQSVRTLEARVSGGYLYVCDLGSLGLIFPGNSPEREEFLSLIFSSTFNQEKSVITKVALTYSSRNGVEYSPVDFNKGSLQYALEHRDLSAIRIICSSLSKFKKCSGELKKVAESALLKVIEQQESVTDDLLECINCLLDFKADDLDPEDDKSLQLQLEKFVYCIRNDRRLLNRICKASYENIIKVICHVELGKLDKTLDHNDSHLLKEYHEHILGRSYGPDSDSILSVLVQSDSVELLKILFEKYKLDANSVNSYGYTALHFAAAYNAKKCVRFLLSKSNVVLSSAKSGLTPLHLAAGSNSFSVLKLLVKHNADAVNQQDYMGRNIMHHAAMGGYVDNLLLCIDIGMDVNTQATTYNRNGEIDELRNSARSCTPLHFAIESGKLEVVSCLLSCKHIDLSIENSEGCTPITTVDHNGNNLIHQAVSVGSVGVLLKALQLGWQEVILEKNSEGKTPFDIAIASNDIACSAVLFPYLCNQFRYERNRLKKIFEVVDSHGNTFLHQAVAACKANLVKKILSYDLNIMSVNADGETPLDIAIRGSSVEMVELLIADDRQGLFSRKGSSYVMKLMNKNLLTKEIYKKIKRKSLRKERCCYVKLTISLMLTFVLITCVVVLYIIEFQDNLCNIFGTIAKAGYSNILIIGVAALILSIIWVSCGIIGRLWIKLIARNELLHMEVSNTCSSNTLGGVESVSSGSSEYKHINTYMNGEQTTSESSTECESEAQMFPSSLRSEKYKALKSKRLTSVSLLDVSNEMNLTSVSLR